MPAGPGQIATPSVRGGIVTNPASNPDWVTAFVNYWVSRWDAGDHTVPEGWVSALDGEPDPNSKASARTVLAFTRYAQRYRPGMDKGVDQVMPWVPPGPNDFMEDPVVKAARIVNEQWDKTFDEGIRRYGLNLDQSERNNIRTAFNQAFQNELTQYATAAGIYNNTVAARLNEYNTAAGIYNNSQNAAGSRLQSAGTLAQGLQNIYDDRTKSAIQAKLNPGDYLKAEYETRALQGPQGTTSPAYRDVPELGEVIRKLIDFKPDAQPTAPNIQIGQPPAAPNQGSFQMPPGMVSALSQVKNLQQSAPPPPGGPLQNRGSVPPGYTNPTPKPNPNVIDPNWANKNSTAVNPIYESGGGSQYWDSASQSWKNKDGSPLAMAYGSGQVGTDARQMIVGDPQASGAPNPELVNVINPGPQTRVQVTPLMDIVRQKMNPMGMQGMQGQPPNPQQPPMYAYGTDQTLTSYPDEAYQNQPLIRYNQNRNYADQYNTLAKGFATGAFGQQVAEPGSFDVRGYLRDIQNDPVATAMLTSSYQAANRDLASVVARARARAPFGQAVSTSLIRTRR